MQVAIEQYGNSLFIIEPGTNLVLCTLPGIMAREDIKPVFKALSIMLKEMGNAAGKSRLKKRQAK